MYATDFIYDGKYLSDYNFIICSIGSSDGVNEVSAGSEITFNQVAMSQGEKYSLTSTRYDTCISTTFDICKDPDYFEDIEITESEYREIIRWLNRKEYLKFCFRTNYDRVCYYNASFNIKNIYINDVLYGFRLTMNTNKPFGYGEEIEVVLSTTTTDTTVIVKDESDEIGFIYPQLKVHIGDTAGDLIITNETHAPDTPTIIRNCLAGEVITIDCENQVIDSTYSKHICDDFNYRFFKLGNYFRIDENEISISLPCKVTITYKPIIKNIN